MSGRPSTDFPLSPSSAVWNPSVVAMVTKANPLLRPVIRSVMRLTSVTGPNAPNISWTSFSVVLKLRFPTYNFVFINDLSRFRLAAKDIPHHGGPKLQGMCIEARLLWKVSTKSIISRHNGTENRESKPIRYT